VTSLRTRTRAALRGLGHRISELRRERGWTQEKIAERLRMLPENYARIEQGWQNVTIDTLVRVAEALDVTLRDLFELTTTPRPRPGRPGSLR
jgi:transcriptional regulator with XRE-family HTH domain